MNDHSTALDKMTPDQRALWEARDAILCAATNLECGQPQRIGPGEAARLRAAADLLTKLDSEATTYINELGANSRDEMLNVGRAIYRANRMEYALRRILEELPDYMTEVRNIARVALYMGSKK
jgi:hypothetical protein